MRQIKLRVIKTKQPTASEVLGLTVPLDVAIFFKDVYFNVYKSGTSIVFESGTQNSQISSQLDNLDLRDFKI